VALGSAALSACTTFSDTFETGPFLKEQITGDSWRACLAREYQAEARAQVRAGRDWTEATEWAAKGRAALEGMNQTSANPCDCATAQARAEILTAGSARLDLESKYQQAKTACAGPAGSAEARPR
jgi:hypothetical protein